VWLWREYIDEESMDHLEACESDHCSWSGSKQVCSTTTIKARDTLFTEHLLYAVYYTCIPLL